MLLVSLVVLVASLGLPVLAVVGAWVGARRLTKRADVPPAVRWVAVALVVPGALFVVNGIVSVVVAGVAVPAGEHVLPSEKARRLAETIASAMNSGAAAFLCAVVAALWLGFCAWRWRRESGVGQPPP